MKKYVSLLLAISIVFTVFVGCNKAPETTETESTTKAETASVTVQIDGSRFTEEFSEEDFYSELNSVEGLFHTKNEETKQYTLTMTETAYKELKELKSKPVLEGFDTVKNNAENYVTDIKYDEDFRNLIIFADREKTPEEIADFDDTLVLVMGYAMVYQMYTVEGQSVKITVVDSESEEVLKTVSYPMVIA